VLTVLTTYIVETLWDNEEFILSRTCVGRGTLFAFGGHACFGTADGGDPDAARSRLCASGRVGFRVGARPVAPERWDGRSALLIEDPGGELLARMVGKPWDLTPFLHVAR
jgi:hypothetical protein